MRAGDHDPSEDRDDAAEGEAQGPGPRPGAPRFARLARGRGARRLSPRRLVAGAAVALVVGWGAWWAARRGWEATTRWVAAQPEHQVRFDAIELVPPPPPYIARGAADILEAVRAESRYGETIPLLGTDLEALRVDLKRNPWLEEVRSVRSSYGRLVAEVVYRKPLALIEVEEKGVGTVIDRHGVVMPTGPTRFAWAERYPTYRPAGESRGLVSIRGLGVGEPDREGRVWKSSDPAIGAGRVLEAASLAEEVAARAGAKTPGRRAMPEFVEVVYRNAGPDSCYYLRERAREREPRRRNTVWWGSAPGREGEHEPRAARKWEMLAAFVDARGPLHLDANEYLAFHWDQAVVVRPAPSQTRPAARGK